MDSHQGTIGDLFMNQIEGAAAFVPYLVAPGNHESAFNFSHYTEKFRGQPSNSSKSGTVWTASGEAPNNWYFSWNAGMVHFVAISTEIYFNFPFMIKEQWEWLQSDLETANKNRSAAPWIVVYGHRPLYCSATPNSDCGKDAELVRMGVKNKSNEYQFGMEQLFYEQGVDFYICGHEHNYERMYDIYRGETTRSTSNMPSTTYIVTGSAGCTEGKEGFQRKQPEWSAYRTEYYSWSRFYVYNSSHVQLQQVVSDSTVSRKEDGSVCDETWFVQDHHGPFAKLREEGLVNMQYHEDAMSKTVLKPGMDSNWTYEPELTVPYLGNNKEDYRGVEGVHF